jgi:hypothetical protein
VNREENPVCVEGPSEI